VSHAPSLRERILRGDDVVGTMALEFLTLGAGPLAAHAGADFVVFDAEHSGRDWQTLAAVTATTRATTASPIIRVPTVDPSAVSRALDLGAHGVMVPLVADAEQARALAAASRYPPAGRRGAVFGLAQDDYAEVDAVEAMARRDAETVLILQIETVEGVGNADAIAAVDGVDVLWVGHLDLTASMGIPGRFDDPRYLDAIDRVAAAAAAHGKAAGFADLTGTMAPDLRRRGYHVLAAGVDYQLYSSALRRVISDVRPAPQERQK